MTRTSSSARGLAALGAGLVAALLFALRAAVPTSASAVTLPDPIVDQAVAAKPGQQTIVLAGGCFWGVQAVFQHVKGVVSATSGYAGGKAGDTNYEEVSTGTTGHAESVRIVFDPSKLSYADLLEKWFFRMHDPTTKNRQGNDVGSQYRSAIFVTSPAQRKIAEEAKAHAAKSGRWKNPIVTEIVDAGAWTPAESNHQDYLQKNPGGYTCHYLRD